MFYNVKAGIIGLEDLGKTYAQLLKDHVKNLNLLAACGRTQAELLYAKNDLSLDYVYSDEKALFENHDIDALFVFSEIHLRPHHAIEAIKAGKSVFVLSPMAMNLEDAQAISKVADSHPSQKTMAGSFSKFSPLFKKLKSEIDKKTIGSIQQINVDSSLINSINKEQSKPSGSVFFDKILEEIELSLWIINEDVSTAQVKLRGSHFDCQANTASGKQINFMVQPQLSQVDSYMSILGSNGKIVVSNRNTQFFTVYDSKGHKTEVFIDLEDKFQYSEYLQMHHFVRSILDNNKPITKIDDMVQAMKLSLAFEKSKVLNSIVEL